MTVFCVHDDAYIIHTYVLPERKIPFYGDNLNVHTYVPL